MQIKTRNSSRLTWEECPRKFYWSWEREFVSQYGSTAFRFGSAWHAVLARYYQHVIDNGWQKTKETPIPVFLEAAKEVWEDETDKLEFCDDHRTLENLELLFIHYLEQYVDEWEYLTPLEVEKKKVTTLTVPNNPVLYPHSAGMETENIYTVDMIAEMNGERWIVEHKTTGMYISSFMRNNARSSQAHSYYKLKQEMSVAGVLTNVVQMSSRKGKTGNYGKVTTNFMRQPETFTTLDMEEYDRNYFDIIEQTAKAEHIAKGSVITAYPCRVNSCTSLYGECRYRILCDQAEKFISEETVPEGFRIQDVEQSLKGVV